MYQVAIRLSRCASLGVLLFWVALFPLVAQQTIKITGYVLDRENKPIPFATVKCTSKAIGTTASLKGAYTLTTVATQDSIAIAYSAIGYRTVVKHFPKGLRTHLRLNVVLPDTPLEMGTVTVVAPSKRAQNLNTIAAENIRVAVGPSSGVESLVGTYAGVTQRNEMSSQYSVRGGSYDENMVYINGLEIPRPLLVRTAQQEGISVVHPDMTQNVTFSAGAFTAEYGDKMSSVLDIRYKQPKAFEAAVEAGLQGDALYVGSQHRGFNQITGVRFKDGRTLLGTLDTKGEYQPLYLDAQSYMGYRLSDKWSLRFLGNISFTHYQFTPKTRETSFGTLSDIKQLKVFFEGSERDRFVSYFAAWGASFRPTLERQHDWQLHYYHSSEKETYDIEGAYLLNNALEDPNKEGEVSPNTLALATGLNQEHARNHLHYHLATLSYKGRATVRDRHRLKWGASLQLEEVQDHINEWTRRDSAGYNIPRHAERIEMLHNLYGHIRLSSARFSSFVLDNFSIAWAGGVWSFYPGIRFSFWSANKELIVSPRWVASFTPDGLQNLSFRWATGLYYQAPFYKELRTVVHDAERNQVAQLNRSVRSQGSWQMLLGGDYLFKLEDRPFRFTTEVYGKYLYRLNPYRMENVRVRYLGANVGQGYVVGIDTKLFGQFVPDVDSWVTASLLTSKQYIPEIGSMPLPNAPVFNSSLFFQDYIPGYKRLRVSLRGVFSSGLPQFRPTEDFLPPVFIGDAYKRADIGFTYRLFDREQDKARARRTFWKSFRTIDVTLECFNLFDMSNVSGYYWVTDAFNQQYAVPNYLTRRQLNLRLRADF